MEPVLPVQYRMTQKGHATGSYPQIAHFQSAFTPVHGGDLFLEGAKSLLCLLFLHFCILFKFLVQKRWVRVPTPKKVWEGRSHPTTPLPSAYHVFKLNYMAKKLLGSQV